MLATDLGYEAKQSTYGGTAPCDFLRTFRKDMRRTTPRYVVVAFTGNNMTSCMADEAGEALVGDALYSTYRRDLNRYARIATRAGSTIVLVGPPESRGRDAGPMNEVYKTIADRYRGALYVYGGTYLTPRRQFRATAPCLSGETPDRGCGPDHRIKIRNPDGTHLCPEQPDGYSRSFSGCPRLRRRCDEVRRDARVRATAGNLSPRLPRRPRQRPVTDPAVPRGHPAPQS
ncbi:MAG: hypothetical protein M5T61_13700 [Acidimicrobiia bacterium]|nr:hypothetical protein [Acidimicrobiia bacterium]